MKTLEVKQKEAAERQKKYDALTLDQKLANPRLGNKERRKLMNKKVQAKK